MTGRRLIPCNLSHTATTARTDQLANATVLRWMSGPSGGKSCHQLDSLTIPIYIYTYVCTYSYVDIA